MTTQNTPGDGSHPDIPVSNNGPTIRPIAVRHRSTWLSPAHRYRMHPAWPQEGGPGPNRLFPIRVYLLPPGHALVKGSHLPGRETGVNIKYLANPFGIKYKLDGFELGVAPPFQIR